MLKHAQIERNLLLMAVLTTLTVAIGGLVQVTPLFYLESTIEKVEGMRPYSPLELAGRNIYIREGCYLCHSQQVRPFRDEVERYGHFSIAAESVYDHPFQWGSKRTGPDLHRVGGKYSNAWHTAHLIDPRSVVPESVMPGYPFLANTPLKFDDAAEHLKTLNWTDLPQGDEYMYSPEQIANAIQDLKTQANGDADDADVEGLKARYPKAVVGDFDGNPEVMTELDALIAYLQMLGTLVDFEKFDAQMLGDPSNPLAGAR